MSARPHSPLYHHAFALLTILIWSFSFLFIIRLNQQISPLAVVVVRKDIFALLVIAMWIIGRPKLRGLSRRDWAIVVGLAIVGGPLYHLIFAWSAGVNGAGDSRIDPGLLGLILATVPIHAAWLAWLCLGERPSIRTGIALSLGLVGVGAVLIGRYGRIDLLPRDQLEGPIAATLSAMVAGGIVILMRAGRTVYRPLQLVAVTGALTVLMIAPLHAVTDLAPVAELDTGGWIAAAWLGVAGSGLAYLTWATALSGLPAVTVAVYLFLASVLAALWGWIFDGVAVGWPFALGAALVLTGLVVMARAPRGVSAES